MQLELKLGEILMMTNKINEKQLKGALAEQDSTGIKFSDILISRGIITVEDVAEAVDIQLGEAPLDLQKYNISESEVKIIPEQLARRHNMIVIDKIGNALLVAMADPFDIFAIDDITMFTKGQIKVVLADAEQIINMTDKYYIGDSAKKVLDEFNESSSDVEEEDTTELASVASAPVVKLLNSIIEQAAQMKGSDIHIEPYEFEVRVRVRVDGDLKEIMVLPKTSLSSLVTRIKIMGKMNIAERRIPLDGRVETVINDRPIDLRISTLPTVYGEKVVIRILDKMGFNYNKEGLGFSERNLNVLNKILSQPYGIILVTGPTGSGKSTTLYTVLKELNKPTRNVITVEDPVEYKLHGINQVQVNAKSGLTFAAGLRSILRQDPDVVMVGEIRDGETAEIAIRAAITGHLVLSTIHTNDSPSTVSRLVDMGVEPYMVSSAVIGILSQRLVKVLCPYCKEKYIANDVEKKMLEVNLDDELELYRAVGCNSCNGGYKGRTAVHELMPIDEDLRRAIDKGANTEVIRNLAFEGGMKTLLQAASALAISGKTSYEEVMRIGFTLG